MFRQPIKAVGVAVPVSGRGFSQVTADQARFLEFPDVVLDRLVAGVDPSGELFTSRGTVDLQDCASSPRSQ